MKGLKRNINRLVFIKETNNKNIYPQSEPFVPALAVATICARSDTGAHLETIAVTLGCKPP